MGTEPVISNSPMEKYQTLTDFPLSFTILYIHILKDRDSKS